MKRKINWLQIFTFLLISTSSLVAQSPGNAYTVQQNDWLSKISNTAYNNPHLYYRIIDGTNKKAASDKSYRSISRANDLQVGQKIWIPDFATETNLTHVPETNCEIRLWYNYQVVAIGKINERWAKAGLDLETRAQRAFELRHNARVNARFMMQNATEVEALRQRDLAKYKNPDGPTFEYLMNKNMSEKGLSKEASYQAIIDSSSRTDRNYNKDCQ